MLGCIEMLRSGTTSVQDDCFFVPAPEPDIIDAEAQAYEDSGIRARLALDQPELSELEKLPFLRDILPPICVNPFRSQGGCGAAAAGTLRSSD